MSATEDDVRPRTDGGLDTEGTLRVYLQGLLSSDLAQAMRYSGLSPDAVTNRAGEQLLSAWRDLISARDRVTSPNTNLDILLERVEPRFRLLAVLIAGIGFAGVVILSAFVLVTGGGRTIDRPWLLSFLVSLVTPVAVVIVRLLARTTGQLETATRVVAFDREAALERFTRALALPTLRSTINELRETTFATRLGDVQADGLRDLITPELEVTTKARQRLAAMLGNLHSGTVGISGRRGVGKTTLIRGALKGEPERQWVVSVALEAPVRFEPQEFVKHLFAELCLAVLGDRVQQEQLLAARQQRRMARFSSGATFIGLVGVLFGAYAVAVKGTEQGELRPVFLVVSAVAIGSAVTMWMVFTTLFRGEDRQRRYSEEPEVLLAWESLDALRYLETQTAEMGAELSTVAAKFTGKRGVSRVVQTTTLPELVGSYDRLVRSLAQKGRVFIGIDELDKMASLDEAQRFLNGVKTLFGQPNTFYLVSMSDDAMRSFEQRGLPVRDVFDSMFDDVLAVGPLDFSESTELLRRRVTGLAPPFVALCHVLSAGLPRELVRVAREMLFNASPGERLGDTALRLIAWRNAARVQAAALVAQQHVSPDGSQPILSWLRLLPQAPDAAGLEAMCDVGAPLAEVALVDELSLLVVELAASWYHDATVAQIFADLREPEFDAMRVGGDLELLTQGRLDLESAPHLAWDTVSRCRSRLGGTPLDYPVVAVEPQPESP